MKSSRLIGGIVLLLCLLTACAKAAPASDTQQEAASASSAPQQPAALPASETSVPESAAENTTGDAQQTLVLYFSGTGNTKAVAQTIAQQLGCSALEIVPEEPYTTADLDYTDEGSRANLEMNDDAARPGIAADLSAAEESDIIYLGYPIWWGTAPRIINTLLESYDLSGAKIYTFCTSGSSGVERSVSDLQKAYPHYNIISGQRFRAGVDAEEIRQWLDSLAE